MRRLHHLVVSCVLLSGCFGPGEGVEVPADEIYFPVGLALDRSKLHLFVVSSDFDLQYNGGAIQSYDVEALVAALPKRCVTDAECVDAPRDARRCDSGLCVVNLGDSPCLQGDRADADRLLYPARCNSIQPKTVLTDLRDTGDGPRGFTSVVKTGAFATDAIVRSDRTQTAQRLLVPVRGDATLHWLDVSDHGGLFC